MIAMIPIGAIPRRISSAQPIEVERNCFVISSPKRVRRAAKSEKALFWKFCGFTVGAVVTAGAAVDVEELAILRGGAVALDDLAAPEC